MCITARTSLTAVGAPPLREGKGQEEESQEKEEECKRQRTGCFT